MNANRIVVKLGVTIFSLFLVVLFPMGFVINQIFSGFYYSQVQKQIEQLASRYAAEISASTSSMTVTMIEMMSAFADVKSLVVDAEGQIVANSGVSWRPLNSLIPKEEMNRLASAKAVQIEMVDPVSQERFVASGQPIVSEGRFYGAVYVLSSVDVIDRSLQKVRGSLILSGVGAFFLALGLIFVLSRKLSEPLVRMEKATRRIAKGELDTRVDIPSNDEIGSLAKAINDLAVDLQRYRDTRSEFFSNISHDLRTPMTNLEGYANVLREGLYESEEEKHKYLDIIHDESKRLTHLIQDLFELSKMEEGKISLQMEWIDLTEVVELAIRKVEPKAKHKKLVIRADMPQQVPFVYADGQRMQQVFMNLLDNAIRYTESGSILVEITQAGPGKIVTAVEDTGIGIPEEELPWVFERFYRVEKSRSREHGGTGLGLAIVKQLVEMQGGTVQVSSVPGKGTRFEIILPIGGDSP
ncbi:MAG TPA: HAMP domain-containing sensor histidine kinase [Paenibacillus sp.]|uniref:sensor histidine kinase n=1 Tax=Paenibacillus sp. TaxID=58172 RepID=UPI002B838000|nr:HAMP domain-containing sensor histidine kinase [Paenibacillus sp.]HUC91516.1 HAMP domain-containing sensor histidine kinase [Paenibacillus sp.]